MIETWSLLVREPNPNHNHWGLEMLSESRLATKFLADKVRDKTILTVLLDGESRESFFCGQWILVVADEKDWHPFWQGGHHKMNDPHNGWYYFEFWGLPGEEDHRNKIIEFIHEIVKEKS